MAVANIHGYQHNKTEILFYICLCPYNKNQQDALFTFTLFQ